MDVGRKMFLHPDGEHPPRMYPVKGNSSFIGIKSHFLFPDTFAAIFKSTSCSPGITHTKYPDFSPWSTRVLNTCSISSFKQAAT